MTASRQSASPNRLLAALPMRAQAAVAASCELVELTFDEVMCESGDPIHHVYFPVEGFISLVTVLHDDARLEVGIVGDEGMLGTSVVLGVDVASEHALVQGSGGALRMTTTAFLRHCRDDPTLRRTMLRYVDVLMRQLALTAACAHHHLLEARLARWLLVTRDRAHSERFHLTHQFLGYMLGVRRPGITEAASALQGRGLIDYSRGGIAILDGAGLEKASCACYRRGNEMYERILGVRRARRSR